MRFANSLRRLERCYRRTSSVISLRINPVALVLWKWPQRNRQRRPLSVSTERKLVVEASWSTNHVRKKKGASMVIVAVAADSVNENHAGSFAQTHRHIDASTR